ncbi:GNAT superfamily N-acetyltransferase [Marmoricola sp. OAE513]|uniref:GNAT family N-acetyltransferase n=1 Tax=Marmoricola sp. OAE513 TaxID=2817894 RepID=UPI001AE423D5
MSITFVPLASDAPEAERLLAEYAAEIAAMYDGADLAAPGMPSGSPADFAPPGGTFLVGFRDGEAVCCGAVKGIGPEVGEIKRMYVVPDARRQGIARLLLAALEDAARSLGHGTVRMDTGSKHQHAVAFYEASGYRPIADYNQNPLATWFGEKVL